MSEVSTKTKLVLGLQHVMAMFGATVLVPFITGLDPAIALLSAGIGTLLFHLCSGGKVPVFLGSSFAFMTGIIAVLNPDKLDPTALTDIANKAYYLENLAILKGGLIVAGLVYVIISLIVKLVGVDVIKKLFPAIVTGPIIIVIGLNLSSVAIDMAMFSGNRTNPFSLEGTIVAAVVVITMIIVSIFAKGFFKLVPILIAVVTGYLVAILFGLHDFSSISTELFTFSNDYVREKLFTLPKFTATGIFAIAPIAFVVFIEHIGDITTNGAVVGKNFLEDPGVHRTLLGDGIATIFAGFIGGPANTTYSENTGVLAVTKVYDPSILRLAAVYAIVFSLIGPLAGLLRSIPLAVMGGVSIILFGMIASVGVRIMIQANLDFSHSRNLLIAAIIFVLGIGIGSGITVGNVTISGLFVAAISGVLINAVLPEEI